MKLYVVWSKTCDNLIGVYTDPIIAGKLATTQSGRVVDTGLTVDDVR